MRLALVGVSHRQAPIELRERVAVGSSEAAALAVELAGAGGASGCEAVVLSTCNRTELYLASDDVTNPLEERATASLLALAPDDAVALAPLLYRLGDDSAALHLFRVAAGLDSLVPGEGEILGQVRDAFDGGSTGPLLDRLFRQALHAGRRARVETAIGENPSSVPAAAAALAQQVFGDLGGRTVLLIGAGKMSELTARNLRSRGGTIGAVANRTIEHGAELAEQVESRAVSLAEIPALLATSDVVITSTSAPGFVVDMAAAEAALRGRRGRPILFVDLAVPRDVDPALSTIDGASSMTSTISRPSWRPRSLAAAQRQSTRSILWRSRRSGSGSGRRRLRWFRRSRRSGRTLRRFVRASWRRRKDGWGGCRRASGSSWSR